MRLVGGGQGRTARMKTPMDLRTKTVLITGAASGIGLCTAKEFAQRRAVPLLVDINREALLKELEILRGAGYEAYGFQADITDIERMRELREELTERGLAPDIIVNCAGLTLVCHINRTTHEDWTRMINVNVMGTVNTIDTFLPAMLERRSGHIVNISSIDGIIPIPGQAAYCASKFAITGLTEVLYFDLKGCGIGVTLVCPGAVNTPMADALPVRDLPLEFKGSGFVMRLVKVISNEPERIARHIVEAVTHGRFLVIPGFPSRVFYHYRRLFPKIATRSGIWVARVFDLVRRRSAVS